MKICAELALAFQDNIRIRMNDFSSAKIFPHSILLPVGPPIHQTNVQHTQFEQSDFYSNFGEDRTQDFKLQSFLQFSNKISGMKLQLTCRINKIWIVPLV